MKKLIIFFSIIFLSYIHAEAQSIEGYVQPQSVWFSRNTKQFGLIKYAAGAQYNGKFLGPLGWQIGLEYRPQGAAGNISTADKTLTRADLYYLRMPIGLGLSFGGLGNIFEGRVDLSPGILVDATDNSTATENARKLYKSTDWEIDGRLQYLHKFGPLALGAGAVWSKGLTDIRNLSATTSGNGETPSVKLYDGTQPISNMTLGLRAILRLYL